MIAKRSKGKIRHSDWGEIVARYENGETIAQLGRDFGCTGPAIRYIIRKTGKLRDQGTPGALADAASPSPEQNGSGPAHPLTQAVARPHQERAKVATKADGHGPLGPEMRKRVTGDLAAFLVAFDQTDPEDPESLDALQEATDRLMRAAARVRIELERLFVSLQAKEGRSGRRQPSP